MNNQIDMATKIIKHPDNEAGFDEAEYIDLLALARKQLKDAEAIANRRAVESDELTRKVDALRTAMFEAWDNPDLWTRLEAEYTAMLPRVTLMPLALKQAESRRNTLHLKVAELSNHVSLFIHRRNDEERRRSAEEKRTQQEREDAEQRQRAWWYSLSEGQREDVARRQLQKAEQDNRPSAMDQHAQRARDEAVKQGIVNDWLKGILDGTRQTE